MLKQAQYDGLQYAAVLMPMKKGGAMAAFFIRDRKPINRRLH